MSAGAARLSAEASVLCPYLACDATTAALPPKPAGSALAWHSSASIHFLLPAFCPPRKRPRPELESTLGTVHRHALSVFMLEGVLRSWLIFSSFVPVWPSA